MRHDETFEKSNYNAHALILIQTFLFTFIIDNLPSDAIPADLAKEDSLLGMEYSGTDASGQNVFGIVPAKVYTSSFLYVIYETLDIYSARKY